MSLPVEEKKRLGSHWEAAEDPRLRARRNLMRATSWVDAPEPPKEEGYYWPPRNRRK